MRECMICWMILCATPQAFAEPAHHNDATPKRSVRFLEAEAFQAASHTAAPYVVTLETVGGTQPVSDIPGNATRGDFIVADGPTTGLLYSADGLILTSAFNFVREPSVITVILSDGRRFVGKLLARDEVRRLAMVKIEAADLPTPTWVTDTKTLRVGQWALALGRGFQRTSSAPEPMASYASPAISIGIISGLNRQSGLAIQTDAKLSPTNFGGPLIDIAGRIIGLCVPMGLKDDALSNVEWYDSGIGFAIPYDQILASAKSLAVGHNLRRGLLGVEIDIHNRSTVRIARVAEQGPAGRAGMRTDDRIVMIDDQAVTCPRELREVMRPHLAGQWITVKIERDGQELELPIMLAVPEDIYPQAPATGPVGSVPPPQKASH